MKLPADSIIAQSKIREYLLVPKSRNDKSKFLSSLGFTQNNWQELETAIRTIISENEVLSSEQTNYGIIFTVDGLLKGKGGNKSIITTIWITLHETKETRFVTLKPRRE